MSWARQILGPWTATAFRIALGVIFIVAALPKVADPLGFAKSIANYHLVPTPAINLMAICLPWIELCCGAALVAGVGIRAHLLLVVGMLAVFIGAIASAMTRDLDISCGCFSTHDSASNAMTRWTLYWDVIWLGMALHALVFDRGLLSLVRLRAALRRRMIAGGRGRGGVS